jgi:hypothetical protein
MTQSPARRVKDEKIESIERGNELHYIWFLEQDK